MTTQIWTGAAGTNDIADPKNWTEGSIAVKFAILQHYVQCVRDDLDIAERACRDRSNSGAVAHLEQVNSYATVAAQVAKEILASLGNAEGCGADTAASSSRAAEWVEGPHN